MKYEFVVEGTFNDSRATLRRFIDVVTRKRPRLIPRFKLRPIVGSEKKVEV